MAAADETPRAYLSLPEEQVTRRRIAVVGGGLMGMATAYAAARLGGGAVRVDLYEANQVGHEAGASIDSTRLFRHAYGEWSHYTRWAAETFPLWLDLERQSGRQLYVKSGSVWAAASAVGATSLTTTRAPSSPKRSATARPMPCPAPVTNTTMPAKRPCCISNPY